MRKNCTPGSVRGPLGNWRSYRDDSAATNNFDGENSKTNDVKTGCQT